ALVLGDDGILQNADAVDFHLDGLAHLHPAARLAAHADAAWRAGDDHVAGRKIREARAIFDQARDRGNHLVEIGVLEALARHARLDFLALELTHLVACHHPRPEGTACGEILPRRPLRGVVLIIADGDVVVTGIAGHMVIGRIFRNVAAAL